MFPLQATSPRKQAHKRPIQPPRNEGERAPPSASYLPAFVMIISVPTSWNFSHSSRSCKNTFIPSMPCGGEDTDHQPPVGTGEATAGSSKGSGQAMRAGAWGIPRKFRPLAPWQSRGQREFRPKGAGWGTGAGQCGPLCPQSGAGRTGSTSTGSGLLLGRRNTPALWPRRSKGHSEEPYTLQLRFCLPE